MKESKIWRTLSGRAWTCFFRQRESGILIDTPANKTCSGIFNGMEEADRDILQRFMLSDSQIPQRFEAETGIPADRVIAIADNAGKRLLSTLFGFEVS